MILEEIIDKHQGTIGFVCGASPSLRHLTKDHLDFMQKHTVLAVNSALSKIQFADYFVADDIGVKNWDYYIDILPKLDTHCLLYKDKLEGHIDHLDERRVTWFKHKWWYDPKNKTHNPDGLVMRKEQPIIGARTGTGSAVHLAHILGCDPIVLLGCDCCYDGLKRYYWQFEGERFCKRVTGEPVFSFPNRGKHQGEYVDAHCMDFLDYWDKLAEQSEKDGITILNASGGILECFKRVKLEELYV